MNKEFLTERTFVVLGCPRGGTSLLAGMLNVAGVHMGAYRTCQYEDPEFKIPIKHAKTAYERLQPVIEHKNRRYKYWGWKVPNNIYYIEQIQPLLINPYYLFIYRDPYRIARSSAAWDKRDWAVEGKRLLQVAINHTAKVRAFQESLQIPHHVFQLEEIHENPTDCVDEFTRILAPMRPSRKKLLRFIDPSGGYHYHDLALLNASIRKLGAKFHRHFGRRKQHTPNQE